MRNSKIRVERAKQPTKQMPKDAIAQIRRLRSSIRCAISGARVASSAAWSSGVGSVTAGRSWLRLLRRRYRRGVGELEFAGARLGSGIQFGNRMRRVHFQGLVEIGLDPGQ